MPVVHGAERCPADRRPFRAREPPAHVRSRGGGTDAADPVQPVDRGGGRAVDAPPGRGHGALRGRRGRAHRDVSGPGAAMADRDGAGSADRAPGRGPAPQRGGEAALRGPLGARAQVGVLATVALLRTGPGVGGMAGRQVPVVHRVHRGQPCISRWRAGGGVEVGDSGRDRGPGAGGADGGGGRPRPGRRDGRAGRCGGRLGRWDGRTGRGGRPGRCGGRPAGRGKAGRGGAGGGGGGREERAGACRAPRRAGAQADRAGIRAGRGVGRLLLSLPRRGAREDLRDHRKAAAGGDRGRATVAGRPDPRRPEATLPAPGLRAHPWGPNWTAYPPRARRSS